MTDKVQNLITRAITGALFVTIMVVGFFNPRAMVALFAFITGMAVWEYTGLVNQRENIKVNRFISTIAGVYFFIAHQPCFRVIVYHVLRSKKHRNAQRYLKVYRIFRMGRKGLSC